MDGQIFIEISTADIYFVKFDAASWILQYNKPEFQNLRIADMIASRYIFKTYHLYGGYCAVPIHRREG
jgi:hypothetical protein